MVNSSTAAARVSQARVSETPARVSEAASARVSEAAPARASESTPARVSASSARVSEAAPAASPEPAPSPVPATYTPAKDTPAKPLPVRQYLDATVVPVLRQARTPRPMHAVNIAPHSADGPASAHPRACARSSRRGRRTPSSSWPTI